MTGFRQRLSAAIGRRRQDAYEDRSWKQTRIQTIGAPYFGDVSDSDEEALYDQFMPVYETRSSPEPVSKPQRSSWWQKSPGAKRALEEQTPTETSRKQAAITVRSAPVTKPTPTAGKVPEVYHFQFPYQPLEEDTIRLLRFEPQSTPTDIHLSITHQRNYFDSSRPINYVALSYTWSDPFGRDKHFDDEDDDSDDDSEEDEQDRDFKAECLELREKRFITLDGRQFAVTQNLLAALSAILQHHHDRSTAYWIDAICLNQQDVPEKNQQVHQMWRIYSAAREVFAWLGPADDNTGVALEALDKHTRVGAPDVELTQDEQNKLVFAMMSIERREYFQRTWIIPEFLNARKVKMICGHYSYDVDRPEKHCIEATKLARMTPRLVYQRWAREQEEEEEDDTPHLTLVNVLQEYDDTSCFDSRDIVFAMIGDIRLRRMGAPDHIKPNYTWTPMELMLQVLLFAEKLWLARPIPDGQSLHQLKCENPYYYLDHLLFRLAAELGKRHNRPPGDAVALFRALGPLVEEGGGWKHGAIVLKTGMRVSTAGPLMTAMFDAGTAAEMKRSQRA